MKKPLPLELILKGLILLFAGIKMKRNLITELRGKSLNNFEIKVNEIEILNKAMENLPMELNKEDLDSDVEKLIKQYIVIK